MSHESPIRLAPRWLHVWAILTAATTLPLIALGGLVTTRKVGMADPVWPTTPWFLFFTSWSEPRPGFLIEHTHRLAGYILGCLAIVLAIGMWRCVRGPLRWMGVVCLLGVSLQGLLGGVRVIRDALAGTELAAIHGVFGQVVFCIIVAVAFLTRRPTATSDFSDESRRRCRRFARLLVALVFLQLVWGALVRHNPTGTVQRLHFFTAFLVVAAATWLIKMSRERPDTCELLRFPSRLLGLFLLLQVMLGVEAWLGKFGTDVPHYLQVLTTEQVVVRTAHVLVGTGILATSVVMVLILRLRN